MTKPLVVSIPHRLGKAEAARRLKAGFANVPASFAGALAITEETWTGEHLDFRVNVLRQPASGTVDVADDHVRLEVQLPWFLSALAEKAKALIERHGKLLIEKK